METTSYSDLPYDEVFLFSELPKDIQEKVVQWHVEKNKNKISTETARRLLSSTHTLYYADGRDSLSWLGLDGRPVR